MGRRRLRKSPRENHHCCRLRVCVRVRVPLSLSDGSTLLPLLLSLTLVGRSLRCVRSQSETQDEKRCVCECGTHPSRLSLPPTALIACTRVSTGVPLLPSPLPVAVHPALVLISRSFFRLLYFVGVCVCVRVCVCSCSSSNSLCVRFIQAFILVSVRDVASLQLRLLPSSSSWRLSPWLSLAWYRRVWERREKRSGPCDPDDRTERENKRNGKDAAVRAASADTAERRKSTSRRTQEQGTPRVRAGAPEDAMQASRRSLYKFTRN